MPAKLNNNLGTGNGMCELVYSLGALDFANASPYLGKIVMHGLSLPMEL